MTDMAPKPIGVFDSGYGGLSILKSFRARMPSQAFIYLGDHDNAPYGSKPKEDLFRLTTKNIDWLFKHKCQLVILACNTASSILRSIQHQWLPRYYPENRVLGVVVPTVERVTGVSWSFSPSAANATSWVTVGVLATEATVRSEVYPLEIHKRAPHIRVVQQACPTLTNLIEEGAPLTDLQQAVEAYVGELRAQLKGGWPDYVLLGCTHYALIEDLFSSALSPDVCLINQADCITSSFGNYLERHPHYRYDVAQAETLLFTTGEENKVNKNGRAFLFDNAKFITIDRKIS